nr:hypothetical protein [Streptomyces sp. NRRL S-1022]
MRLAAEMTASFVAFDVLQAGGRPLLKEPYAVRRARLERPFTKDAVAPPWLLCRATDDVRVAQEWLTTWTRQPGVEGLVIKGRAQHYPPGVRGWSKVRRRDTTEAVIGAITGTLARPRSLLLGRYDTPGILQPVAVVATPLPQGLEGEPCRARPPPWRSPRRARAARGRLARVSHPQHFTPSDGDPTG